MCTPNILLEGYFLLILFWYYCLFRCQPNRGQQIPNIQLLFWIFPFEPQSCLTFSLIELKTLLRRCLIHKAIIILRLILHVVYLCPSPPLGLSMSYLYDLIFVFSLIFIVIYHLTLFKLTYLFFVQFLEHFLSFLDVTFGMWMKRAKNFQTTWVQPQGAA